MLPIQKITGLLLAAVAAAKKTPSGSYSGNGTAGSKSFETAWYANMDGTTFDVSFRGGLSVECSQSPTGKGEAYALDDSGKLTLPNIQKEGAAAASPSLFIPATPSRRRLRPRRARETGRERLRHDVQQRDGRLPARAHGRGSHDEPPAGALA